MLGPTMVYSCAYFGSPDDTLDEAQTRKLDLVCRKLELQPGERLLDIGCGWGSLLIHAASEYGVRGVGVTVSEQQAQLARERIAQAGLSDRLEVRLQDYRDVADGPYDKIASIGMFEHVGRANLPAYFARRARAAAARRAVPQPRDRAHRRRSPGLGSFSERYVFPDGELHTQGVVLERARGRRLRGARRRVAAPALRRDAAPLGRQPRRAPRGRDRRDRRAARARLAPAQRRRGARASSAARCRSTRC